MQGRLIWVGRERASAPSAQWAAMYRKRLRPYLKFDEQLIKPLQGGNRSEDEIRVAETARIVAALDPRDVVILCDERGKPMTSRGLAKYIDQQRHRAVGRIVWIVGGSMGVADTLRHRADRVLSLSQMTLPHALARVMLLEQIYRACCILQGHPYHHES